MENLARKNIMNTNTNAAVLVAVLAFLASESKDSALRDAIIGLMPGASGGEVFGARLGLVSALAEKYPEVRDAVERAAAIPNEFDPRTGNYVPRNKRLALSVLSELAYRANVPRRSGDEWVKETRAEYAHL